MICHEMLYLALALVPMDIGEVIFGKLKCDREKDMKWVKDLAVQRLAHIQ